MEKEILTIEPEKKDWHSEWLAINPDNRSMDLEEYLKKQGEEAFDYYKYLFGRLPETDKEKDDAMDSYLDRVNPDTGLKGSEDFKRRNLMYRKDLDFEDIKKYYENLE